MHRLREMQLRLVYSLFKPVVRAAARFGVPIRTLTDLLRLALFEHFAHEGLSSADIAQRFGQTQRHMQSLAQRLKSDFFAAEKQVGITREIEEVVAAANPTAAEITERLPSWSRDELAAAMALLVAEGRIDHVPGGRFRLASRYVVLASDEFPRRIDALNHFLDGAYRAVLQRLVFDNKTTAAVKTITFSALGGEVATFFRRLEGQLRGEVAALEENASFADRGENRFTLGLTLAPAEERSDEESKP